MYKSGHTKSKSDSDFFFNKTIVDEISESLYRYKNIQSNAIKQDKIKKEHKLIKRNTNSWQRKKNTFISILEKILLFKKDLDYYFFVKKIPLIKLDLDNILIIINKKIEELKNKLINECPVLSKSVLIEKLTEFNEIILSLIETKPQEFYKQVKLVILSEFEQIRLEIFELLENLYDASLHNEHEINTEDITKIKNNVTFNHGILFNANVVEGENYFENDKEVHLTSEIKNNIISVIIPRKKLILKFIEDITHELLFSMTRFSYVMDYYTLCISELNHGLFKNISFHMERNRNTLEEKEKKILFIIELIFVLNNIFAKKPIHNFQNIQISLGNFILNNLTELIPKSKIFDLSSFYNYHKKIIEIGIKLFKESGKDLSLFIKSQKGNLFYEFLPKINGKINKFELIKSFRLYYSLKLIFWRSVYTKIESSKQNSSICCRICEQNIPLNDFVLHVFYCKEQNNYYKAINKCKLRIKACIKSLEIYRTKINQEISENQNHFLKKNIELNKIIKIVRKYDLLNNLDENNNDDFLFILIKIYIKELDKSNDYYEVNPQKIPSLFKIVNLTFFIYIYNKTKLSDNDSEDDELSSILGNIISNFIKIFHNTEYILEARSARTKSNRYLNNININFQNSGNFQEKIDSSKDLDILGINRRYNTREFDRRRGSVRLSTFSHQMKIFKNEFSFNRKYEHKKKTNKIQDFSNNYSSVNDSSASNLEKSKDINLSDMRSNSTKIKENFLEKKRLSNNFKAFMNSQKKGFELSEKNESKYKDKIIKYIRNELKEMKYERKFLIKHSKSCKFMINNQLDKGIFKSENNIYNLFKKESSYIEEDNNSLSKSFFSFDKKCNRESSLDYFINPDKDNNENQDSFNNGNNFYLSTKGNNIQLNLKPKKEMSLFSKSDLPILKYSTLKNNRKKSLFKVFNDDIFDKGNNLINGIIQKKKIKENEKISKRRNSSEKCIKKKKEALFNKVFDKIILKNKKRFSSPDFAKDKARIKLLEGAKNLVLIEDSESYSSTSKLKSESQNDNTKIKSNKILKLKSSSSISDNSEDNSDLKKEGNDESIDKGLSSKNIEYRNIFDDPEPEHALFSFDENFFINTEINSRNKILINNLKTWLIELNEEYKVPKDNEEENNKSINNSINSILKSTDSGSKSNFKLILPIAKGGYGNVGLYKKSSTGDLYIIKSVDINKMKEQKLSKTLKNERNIMKEISSDFVVTCYYLFKDKVNYYFVMEYLPGGDVYNLLSSIILPFSTIQLIVAETLLAVKYLHSKNIIHHDIKLENILITKNGHFKLSDFGLSKTIKEKKIKITDEENSSLGNSKNSSNSSLIEQEGEHNDNKVEGTLFYMAPELFTGDFTIGEPIDYWAIGIIIFELFTFKVPFEAETQEETKQNIINYNINWEPMYSDEVSKHYQEYIDSVIDLIKKFIFFNPNQRWGDNDFDKIKNHDFFKGIDWANIKSIKSSAVLSYLKKFVEKNNKKIKEYNKGNNEKNEISCEENLIYDEENNKFSQRLDNLQKRNNELIKLKYKKKEIKMEEHSKNFRHSLFFDLQ